MGLKEAYVEKAEAQLKIWKAQIEELKAKAEKAEADTKIQYYKQVEALGANLEDATKKLGEVKESSEGAWEELKDGAEKAWKTLGDAIGDALAKFK